MSMENTRPQSARLAENAGTVLIYVGVVGVLAAITLTIWALRDLGTQPSILGPTVKIELVTTVGVMPTLVSLLVIAAGIFLQSRQSSEPVPPPATNPVDKDDDKWWGDITE
jgi:hypothetical protein